MFQIVGACFDGSAKVYGSRLGSQAMRYAKIDHTLQKYGIPFVDLGDVSTPSKIIIDEPLRGLYWGAQLYPALTKKIESILQNNHCPIIIGGDRSISLGSITAALNQYQPKDIGVIWIDSYTQFGHPDSSHFIHETVLNLLSQPQNKQIFPFLSTPQLKTENIAFIGVKNEHHTSPFPIQFIQPPSILAHERIIQTVEKLIYWIKIKNISKIWISFNIQSLSKFYLCNTPSNYQGFTIQESLDLASELHFLLFRTGVDLIGIEIVEINPIIDPTNRSSGIALQWLINLLKGLKKESYIKQIKIPISA